MEQDRIYIDKSRQKEIRGIKDAGYLNFDNQKDVFMFALAMGVDCYNGGELENGKDGFFNDRDLNEADKAMIYSLITPELPTLEYITNRELVLKKAEGMANKGFSIILDEMKDKSPEVYMLLMLKKANELFDEVKEKGLLEI